MKWQFTVWDLLCMLDVNTVLTKIYNLHLPFTVRPAPSNAVAIPCSSLSAAQLRPACQPVFFCNLYKAFGLKSFLFSGVTIWNIRRNQAERTAECVWAAEYWEWRGYLPLFFSRQRNILVHSPCSNKFSPILHVNRQMCELWTAAHFLSHPGVSKIFDWWWVRYRF